MPRPRRVAGRRPSAGAVVLLFLLSGVYYYFLIVYNESSILRFISSMITKQYDTAAELLSIDTPYHSSSIQLKPLLHNNDENSDNTESPPENLEVIDFCAEKCRYIPEMCTETLHRQNLSLPAPTCLNYSLKVKDDIYWADLSKERCKDGQCATDDRNNATKRIISWAAARARERRQGDTDTDNVIRCETMPTNHSAPMMFPEEFEFIVKVMANLRPHTYLEWGCGASTSFYPLLASGNVVAIDGYPPWCEKISSEPRVNCMSRQEKRLQFYCPELLNADGSSARLWEMGKIPRRTPDADIENIMDIYVNSIDKTNVTSIDLALVDGRFRFQCAVKLLPFLNANSVLLMHDFWLREAYHAVFEYYYPIGYARSVVALKKKPDLPKEWDERNIYKAFMKRKLLSKDDLEPTF